MKTPARGQLDVDKKLVESLESTDAGLRKFLVSLRQAGMLEAVQGYRAMQMVLLQQRLWVAENKRDHILPLFQSIAQSAGEIHAIFSAFADIMTPLKEIDKLRSVLVKAQEAPDKEKSQGA